MIMTINAFVCLHEAQSHTYKRTCTYSHAYTPTHAPHIQVAALSLEQRKLAAHGGDGGDSGGYSLQNEEAMLALEKRMMDRQARIEGALMQVR
jgi:hypothetical protein